MNEKHLNLLQYAASRPVVALAACAPTRAMPVHHVSDVDLWERDEQRLRRIRHRSGRKWQALPGRVRVLIY
jgi:hypothetical protein